MTLTSHNIPFIELSLSFCFLQPLSITKLLYSTLRHELNEPCYEKTCLSYVNNKDADQPAHPPSLISIFVNCSVDSVIPIVVISKIPCWLL